jgi:hypothetical protein
MDQLVISSVQTNASDLLGLSDGEQHFPESALQRLTDHLEQFPFDFSLNPNTFTTIITPLVSALTRFLAIEREYALKALEDGGDIALNPPIFIVGLPGTGASLLHNLMACDKTCRTPLMWQATEPVEAMGTPSERIRHSASRLTTSSALAAPVVKSANSMDVDADSNLSSTPSSTTEEPCECSMFLSHALHFTFAPLLQTMAILDWTQSAKTLLSQYQFHRRFVQVLMSQAESPDLPAHWVFKDPSHLHSLDVIHAVYPGAKIVWCHRKLSDQILCAVGKQFNTSTTGPTGLPDIHLLFHLSKLHKVLDAAIDHRDGHDDPALFYDVYLEDLLANPYTTVRALYAHYDMRPPSETHVSGMKQWLAGHFRPPREHGLTLQDVGEKDIMEYHRHKRYVKRFPRVLL